MNLRKSDEENGWEKVWLFLTERSKGAWSVGHGFVICWVHFLTCQACLQRADAYLFQYLFLQVLSLFLLPHAIALMILACGGPTLVCFILVFMLLLLSAACVIDKKQTNQGFSLSVCPCDSLIYCWGLSTKTRNKGVFSDKTFLLLEDLPPSRCRNHFAQRGTAAGWNVSAAYQVTGTLHSHWRSKLKRWYERNHMLSVKPVRNSTEVKGVFARA